MSDTPTPDEVAVMCTHCWQPRHPDQEGAGHTCLPPR